MDTIDHPDEALSQSSRWRALARRLDAIEPHQVSGPFARWPRAADAALALLVFLASLVTVSASGLGDGEDFSLDAISDLPAGSFVLLGIAAGALIWRRQRAVAVAVVVMAVTAAWSVAGYGDGHDVAAVVASYSVGRYVAARHQSVLVVAVIAVVSFLGTLIDGSQRVDIAPALLLAAVPWYVGRRVRNRRDYLALLQERAERLEADRHAEAREAVVAERSRIARELHDVVAHQVSMMTVQAGAARTIARDDLDAAIDAMTDVERAGRQTLGELRHLLGVLRPDRTAPDGLEPQPGLADIPALVDDLAHTGAAVHLGPIECPDHLTAAIELSAYRIVQESLTNVLKHAGPAPTVTVNVTIDRDDLVVDVTNTTSQVAPELPSSGFGIAGMHERVTLLGGTLTAAPVAPDGFEVHARIPVEATR